jgi:hypothetical protein
MPGYDGTGPRGLGPMTGRGRGYCVIPLENGSNDEVKKAPVSRRSYIKPRPYNLSGRHYSWSAMRSPNPFFITTGLLRAKWPKR